jgi:hypothetical protein
MINIMQMKMTNARARMHLGMPLVMIAMYIV